MINSIQNIISKEYQNKLLNILNGELPLFYNPSTCIYGDDIHPDDNVKEVPQYTHTFIRNGEINSDSWKLFEPIIYNFMAQTGLCLNMKLIQAKLNFNPKDITFLDNEYYMPHIDMAGKKGITAIYYLNDSDGDTIFFDNNKNIIKKFTPKQGSIIYFNNDIFHTGSPPKISTFRSILNLNWIE